MLCVTSQGVPRRGCCTATSSPRTSCWGLMGTSRQAVVPRSGPAQGSRALRSGWLHAKHAGLTGGEALFSLYPIMQVGDFGLAINTNRCGSTFGSVGLGQGWTAGLEVNCHPGCTHVCSDASPPHAPQGEAHVPCGHPGLHAARGGRPQLLPCRMAPAVARPLARASLLGPSSH